MASPLQRLSKGYHQGNFWSTTSDSNASPNFGSDTRYTTKDSVIETFSTFFAYSDISSLVESVKSEICAPFHWINTKKLNSWFSPTWLLPWRRLLSAMLVPKQIRSIERSQWERNLKSVLCVVLCCGSRSDWDKLIGLYRIPSAVFATRRIWGRTDYRAERKIKNKSDQSRRHGIERRA